MPNSSIYKSLEERLIRLKEASQLYVYIIQKTYLEEDFMICLAHTLPNS